MSAKPVVIEYSKKAMKGREKLTQNEQAILDVLEQDLRETAGKPYGRGWQSLGELHGQNAFHCHITYRKVAVWEIEEHGNSVKIVLCRFEYVGTREKAPY